MVNRGYGPRQGFQGQVIFRGPGSRVEEVQEGIFGGFNNAEHDEAGYGDVHNHWVVELQPMGNNLAGVPAADCPRINIMRNMARWTGDAPSFFTEIMRNFDLDLCMYFVGYMPGQNTVNTVIMPQHLQNSLLNSRINHHRVAPTRINEVYWNQARLETTSTERILSRVRKMNEKYTLNLPEDIQRIVMIPTAEIIAVPVLFRDIINCFNGNGGYGAAAIPTRNNRVHQHQWDEAMAVAQQTFDNYRNRLMAGGAMVPPGVTPMAFLRLGNY